MSLAKKNKNFFHTILTERFSTLVLRNIKKISDQMQSPTAAKIRTLPVNPFHHQSPQILQDSPLELTPEQTERESTTSPNHRQHSLGEYLYGRTNFNYLNYEYSNDHEWYTK